MNTQNPISIGWTTTNSLQDAQKLANSLIQSKLVACAQISSPIQSIYSWNNSIENSQEFRLTLKFPKSNLTQISQFLENNHPYDTPQWITIDTSHVAPTYLNWILQETS